MVVVEIGISHSHAFVFLRISVLVQGQTSMFNFSFCTTQLLVSHIAVSISCECYKAEASQTVGAPDPVTMHARKQNSVLTPFTVSPFREIDSLH